MFFANQTLSCWFVITISTLVGAGCGGKPLLRKSFVECNSTETCQAQIRERDYAFAKAVAAEPIAKRLNVETVTRVVMVDMQRQRVYALDPHFVTLDLATGRELGRNPNAAGDTLWRAGMWLLTTKSDSKTVDLAFIDPAKPNETPIVCSPKPPIPPEAEEVSVHPFDRAGKIYFYWTSRFSYHGGTPPGDAILKQQELAEGCGIMQIEVSTCAAKSVPLEDFLWEPPEGWRTKPGEKHFCAFLSPLRDFPAARASMAPVTAGYGHLSPAARSPMLTVKAEHGKQMACGEATRLTLEARDESANVIWSHPLAPVASPCRPP